MILLYVMVFKVFDTFLLQGIYNFLLMKVTQLFRNNPIHLKLHPKFIISVDFIFDYLPF